MAKILIIGSGVSGLSAGIHALKEGHQAVIYERHFRAGGNLTGWDREGYHIDNCIHWLTGTNPVTKLYKLWVELGALGNVEIYQPKTLFTYDAEGKSLSLHSDITAFEKNLLAVSSVDRREIARLIKAVKAFQRINGIEGEDCNQKCGALKRAASYPSLLQYYGMTTKEMADRFKSPIIRSFLTAFVTEAFSSLALIAVFATFTSKNGGIPAGSSCAMADRMVTRFKSLGGKLYLSNGVRRLVTHGDFADSAILDDGSVEKFDYAVITSDPATAFGSVLDRKFMPSRLKKQYRNSKRLRFSSVQCAFACDLAKLPFSSDAAIAVPDGSKKTLFADYFVIREFSHEKAFAPEGKNIIQSMTFCGEEAAVEFIKCKNTPDMYERKKTEIAKLTMEAIHEKYPMLKGTLSLLDVWTPATYKKYVGSEIGSFMGFLLPPKSLPTMMSGKIKGLKNVVLATQWQMSPGGLPIAAQGGKDAAELIEKMCQADNKKRRTEGSARTRFSRLTRTNGGTKPA